MGPGYRPAIGSGTRLDGGVFKEGWGVKVMESSSGGIWGTVDSAVYLHDDIVSVLIADSELWTHERPDVNGYLAGNPGPGDYPTTFLVAYEAAPASKGGPTRHIYGRLWKIALFYDGFESAYWDGWSGTSP